MMTREETGKLLDVATAMKFVTDSRVLELEHARSIFKQYLRTSGFDTPRVEKPAKKDVAPESKVVATTA